MSNTLTNNTENNTLIAFICVEASSEYFSVLGTCNMYFLKFKTKQVTRVFAYVQI